MNKPVIDIQVNVEGKELKVIVDGIDVTKLRTKYLLLQFTSENRWSYVFGNALPETFKEPDVITLGDG